MQRKPLCFSLIFCLWSVTIYGQVSFTLSAENIANGQAIKLDKLGWKYSPGDDPQFADPQFDDRSWAILVDSAKPEESPSSWRGIGWFRLHLHVAPELANVALNLEMAQLGASEVYVHGKLVKRFGVVGKTSKEETVFNQKLVRFAGISS